MTNTTVAPGINDVYLIGTVSEAPHRVYQQRGYNIVEGMIDVPRRSGAVDRLPFVCEESVAEGIEKGMYVSVEGSMQHRDKKRYPSAIYRHVVYAIVVKQAPADWPVQNAVKLSGHICREPLFRTTPFGRDVCELTIAVPRGNGWQDYVFCIAWNENAHVARRKRVGDVVAATGRFQSREYRKRLPDGTYETRTAHEVSLDSVE